MPETLGANMSFSTVAQIFFLFVLGAYVIYTAVLYYHWQSYGTDKRVTALTLIIYLASTLPLLLVMGLMLMII